MKLRFINTAILTLVSLLTLTGVWGLVWVMQGWVYHLHRIAGWSLLALVPWKMGISWRSLRRGFQLRFDRSVTIAVSLVLAVAVLLSLGLAFVWTWNFDGWRFPLGQSVLSWHWILGLVAAPVMGFHAWRRWPRPKRADFTSRRAALKVSGLAVAGVVGWWLAELVADSRASEDQPRRVSGSRESDSFTGNAFPVTTGYGDGATRVDLQTWRLTLAGLVAERLLLSYDDLLALPQAEITATLDCTVGWYSRQVWRGVPLSDLLARAGVAGSAGSVSLKAVSGYPAEFTLDEAERILLATHVGGEVMNQRHGFPLRAVVPFRKGWFWVKWLDAIEVLPALRG